MLEGLEHPPLGDATRAARRVIVGHRAAADDRAGAERAGLRRVRDQAIEAVHHRSGIGIAEQDAVDLRLHRAMQAPVVPGIAQFIRRDRDGRKALAGFDCTNPKPRDSSGGIRLRSDTSLHSISNRMCAPRPPASPHRGRGR